MAEQCNWCESLEILSGSEKVYWELPDGTRAIEITDVPTVNCNECGISYQHDSLVKEIEDQLFLINTNLIGKSITFSELMKIPRLLKRNYFDFTS